jgi:glycosidase
MKKMLLLVTAIALRAGPVVTKVEPPNWWVGHSLNPVRLWIRGSGLASAQIKAIGHGLEILEEPKVNARGTYLTVSVAVKQPGPHPLKISTKEGSAAADFEGLAPLSAKGRFQGLSPDDLICIPAPGASLASLKDRLPALKEFGFTAIAIPLVYGDEPLDLYGVDEKLGDVAKLRDLADAAHAAGMKLILEMEANHTGAHHPWVEDPPADKWFHGTPQRHIKGARQIWTIMNPHAPPFLQAATLDGWTNDTLPDLNQDEAEVSGYLIQNTLWWIASTGADAIWEESLASVPRKFWRDATVAIKKEYKNLTVVGEVDDASPAAVSFFQGGAKQFDGIDSGIDAMLDFPQYYQMRRSFAQGKSMADLELLLAHDSLYSDPSSLITFLGLPGSARFLSEPDAPIERLKLAFAYLMTSRGIPAIFDGDSDKIAEYAQKLARIRRENPALRRGRMEQLGIGDDVYVYRRDTLLVLINTGAKPVRIKAPAADGTWSDMLDTVGWLPAHGGVLTVELPPASAAIMKQR